MKTDITLIEHAAFLLDNEAWGMRESRNIDPVNPDWKGDDGAHLLHNDLQSTAKQLYALAERMK